MQLVASDQLQIQGKNGFFCDETLHCEIKKILKNCISKANIKWR